MILIDLINSGQLSRFDFPKNNIDKRSFHVRWMEQFAWLRYSKSKNAAFCAVCIQFGNLNKADQFATTGFRNWKKALSGDGGLKRHEKSENHMQSVYKSLEGQKHQEAGKDIHTLVVPNVLADRRYYFSKIISTVRFIAQHGLPFRGHEYNTLLSNESGILLYNCIYNLFIYRLYNLFIYLFK